LHHRFRRHFLVELRVIFKLLDHRAHQGRCFGILGHLLFDELHIRQNIAIRLIFERLVPGALLAFDQHANGAVGKLQQLQDGGDHPEIIELVANRIVFRWIKLRNEKDFLVRIHCLFQGNHGFVATDEQRHDHIGEHHDVAQRQQGQHLGFRGRIGFELGHFYSSMLRCNSASDYYMVPVGDTSSAMRTISRMG